MLSLSSSTLTGRDILLVLILIQASVQLTSSSVRLICGCSSGGIGLSFLQENNRSEEISKESNNMIVLIPIPAKMKIFNAPEEEGVKITSPENHYIII
jgi:hypothetical protein